MARQSCKNTEEGRCSQEKGNFSMNFCKCLSQSDRSINLSLIRPVLVDNRHDVEECSYKESSDVDTINRFFLLQHS